WDADYLYVVVQSMAFADPYRPFSLYLEAANGPAGAAVAGTGIEYSNLVPALPFTPTHLVSVRPLSDDGSGPWNGIWSQSGGTWTRQQGLLPQTEWWYAAGTHQLSFRIPRHAIGSPTHLRIAGHAVNAVAANEWKNLVPMGHTPWSGGGTYHEIMLSGPTAATNWTTP